MYPTVGKFLRRENANIRRASFLIPYFSFYKKLKMSRAERRHKAEIKQTKRLKHQINKYIDNIDERLLGHLKNNHRGCGCEMCKPWKHGLDNKYKISELKQLGDTDGNDDL